jgi:hypothetical protein
MVNRIESGILSVGVRFGYAVFLGSHDELVVSNLRLVVAHPGRLWDDAANDVIVKGA